MNSGRMLIGPFLLAGTLWCGVAATSLPAAAQGSRDARTNLYPIGRQVGVVTETNGDKAWIKLQHRVLPNGKVEFLYFSDGVDVMATGTIVWATTVSPYEAYVTGIKPKKVKHDINEDDDYWSIGALLKQQTTLGPVSEEDPDGGYLSAGMYARTSIPSIPDNAEAQEPVRAAIRALRNRPNRAAREIAVAAGRALVPATLSLETDVPADEVVNFDLLESGLRRFQRIDISDPITKHVLKRLTALARAKNTSGTRVSKEVLGPGTKSTDSGTGR